jgi:hypothetical protein
LLAYVQTNYRHKKIEANASFSFDKQWNERKNGMLRFYQSPYTDRKEDITNLITAVDFSYRLNNYITFTPISYGFRRTTNDLDVHSSNYPYYPWNYDLSRNAQDLKYSIKIGNRHHRNFFMELENSHYFSNTLLTSSYTNLFPGVGFNWSMSNTWNNFIDKSNWNNLWDWWINGDIRLRGLLKKSIGEMPLIYRNNAVLSTTERTIFFKSYYDDADFIFNKDNQLNAETYTKGNIGISYHRHNISVEIDYFNNKTKDYILPVVRNVPIAGGDIRLIYLDNVGAVRHSGYEISFQYRDWYGYRGRNQVSFNTRLNFSQARSKVIEMNKVNAFYNYNYVSFVPMAGFREIATVFAKNEPLGVIYGTTYLRNEHGYIVLDDNGFPMVDYEPKKIGDPTPNFMMSLAPTVGWRNFELSLAMEYSHGGQRWNGTRAYLDFLGMSEESGKNRNENTKDKFIRYGATGVGEDYIEDASYFRLANVSLTYSFRMRNPNNNRIFSEAKIGFSGRNLLLITGYQGVDPSTTLFGYAAGVGLDLFNLPSLRTYSLVASFNF